MQRNKVRVEYAIRNLNNDELPKFQVHADRAFSKDLEITPYDGTPETAAEIYYLQAKQADNSDLVFNDIVVTLVPESAYDLIERVPSFYQGETRWVFSKLDLR